MVTLLVDKKKKQKNKGGRSDEVEEIWSPE
jgi:hypothetical protein